MPQERCRGGLQFHLQLYRHQLYKTDAALPDQSNGSSETLPRESPRWRMLAHTRHTGDCVLAPREFETVILAQFTLSLKSRIEHFFSVAGPVPSGPSREVGDCVLAETSEGRWESATVVETPRRTLDGRPVAYQGLHAVTVAAAHEDGLVDIDIPGVGIETVDREAYPRTDIVNSKCAFLL